MDEINYRQRALILITFLDTYGDDFGSTKTVQLKYRRQKWKKQHPFLKNLNMKCIYNYFLLKKSKNLPYCSSNI